MNETGYPDVVLPDVAGLAADRARKKHFSRVAGRIENDSQARGGWHQGQPLARRLRKLQGLPRGTNG